MANQSVSFFDDIYQPILLVVDDDARLRNLLKKFLSQNQFQVYTAADTIQADELKKMFHFDLMICDVMMPGENGFEYVQRLRKNQDKIPVIMLTAMGQVDDRIMGLEIGADDYLPKPFEPRELLLRIGSILRRMQEVPVQKKQNIEIKFGAFSYNLENHCLIKDDEKFKLSQSEENLLECLLKNMGCDISRDELAKICNCIENPRTVDVLITRLRRRIENDPAKPQYILTVRGCGYTFVSE